MTRPTPSYPHAETLDRFVHTGDLDSAHGLALSWTQQEPGSPQAWTTLALIQERRGDREGAIQALDEAIKLAPEDSSLYFKVGTHRYAQGQYQNAVFAFMASLAASAHKQDDAHDTLAALALAQSHAQLGQDHEAVLALRNVDDESTMWLSGRVSAQSVRNLIRDRARSTPAATAAG